MEESFDVFYGTVCHVCKKAEAVKFCSGCRLVQYCSNNHQKEHWSNHRRFCKCIQKILSKTNGHHVFEEVSALRDHSAGFWNNLRMSVLQLVELMMKRPLTTIESQMLLFPPVCNLCHCYSPTMIPCLLCRSALYCNKEHLEQDTQHVENCKYLELSFNINISRFLKSYTSVQLLSPMKKLNSISMSSNMESLLCGEGEKLTNDDYLLSEHLSYPMTLLHSISSLSNIESCSLNVHVIGADSMEVLALGLLPDVIHLFPHIARVHITLIGPTLPHTGPIPIKDHSKCSVSSVKLFYHDYIASDGFCDPDVVAVFNCGFCEFLNQPDKDIWKKSLPFIIGVSNCLIILTSYTEKESVSDLKRLCNFRRNGKDKYKMLCERKINPFSSLYPHRDWEAIGGGVFYVNTFISVLIS